MWEKKKELVEKEIYKFNKANMSAEHLGKFIYSYIYICTKASNSRNYLYIEKWGPKTLKKKNNVN